jgi:membrane-bound metal-dependent hydrolase YbcI (DUF457 family)
VSRLDRGRPLRGWGLAAFVVVMANLPDVDFLLGALADGSPRSWHRGPTHSLVGAVVAAAVAALLIGRRRFGPVFLLGAALVGSHLVADLVMPDLREAAGIPLFWPVSRTYMTLTLPLPEGLRAFLDLPLGDSTGSFINSLLRWHTAAVFLLEGLLFTPVLLVTYVIRPRGRRAPDQGKMPRSR